MPESVYGVKGHITCIGKVGANLRTANLHSPRTGRMGVLTMDRMPRAEVHPKGKGLRAMQAGASRPNARRCRSLLWRLITLFSRSASLLCGCAFPVLPKNRKVGCGRRKLLQ